MQLKVPSVSFGPCHLGAALVLLGVASGCAVADPSSADEQESSQKGQAVFGGEPATEKRFDAVGAIAIQRTFEIPDEPPFVYFDFLCSGTLVSDRAVVTARHCTTSLGNELAQGNQAYFLLGQSTLAPEQVLAIEGWTEAPSSPTHPGLLYDGGRDVAVAYLADCPKKVRPAKIDEFKPKMVGKKFDIAGFGWNDYYVADYGFYDIGTKFAGEVTARSLGGRWYELLFNGDYQAYLEWYLTDAVTSSPSEDEAQAWWDAYTLEPGYELLAGGLPGESLGCNGDSGGPLLLREKRDLTVVGVSFAVEASQSTICTRGGGYLVFNKEMKRFVERAVRRH